MNFLRYSYWNAMHDLSSVFEAIYLDLMLGFPLSLKMTPCFRNNTMNLIDSVYDPGLILVGPGFLSIFWLVSMAITDQ